MTPVRVLLVEDDEDDAELTTAALADAFPRTGIVEWAASAEAARQWILERHYDIALVDYRLGAVDGIDFVREVVKRGCEVPLILLTGVDAHDVDVEAMSAGAADYLVKSQLTPAILERAIRYAIDAASTHAALRESERRLREIAEHVREVFWTWDYPAGRLTYVNPACETTFGRTCEELLADPSLVLDSVRPSDRPAVMRLLERLGNGGEGEEMFRVVRTDGSERWIHGRGFPVRGTSGHIARLVGTAEDVTAKRRSDDRQEILASVGQVGAGSLDLARTLDGIARILVPAFADACVIDVIDDDGHLRRCAHEFVDKDKEQAVLELRRRFPLKDRPEHPIWRVISTGTSFFLPDVAPGAVAMIATDPEEQALVARARPTSCMFAPLRTGSRVLGVLLLGTDPGRPRFDAGDVSLAEEVGRRAAAFIDNAQLYRQAQQARGRERALAERSRFLADASRRFSEAELETSLLQRIVELVVEQMGDMCVVRTLAADGVTLDLGAAHHRDPRCQPLLVQALQGRQRTDSTAFAHLFATGAPVVGRQPDVARIQPFLPHDYIAFLEAHPVGAFVLVPLRARARIIGTLGVMREQPAEPYGDEDILLIRELADRAAMTIDNARLFGESRQATQTRDDVIAVVSHDVANPLNAILAGAALLMNGSCKDTERVVAIIRRSAERANRIMRDLLDSAALETGRLAVVTKPEEVSRLVADGCEPFENAARAASVRLEREGAEGVRVLADRDRVVQVLGNLIGNALKFTPSGGVVGARWEPAGDEICFSISDTGGGISERDMPRVFDRYYQADPADRRGVGLGLAISKGIVEAHGGRIWVESHAGAGATFRFTLPRAGMPDDGPSASGQMARLQEDGIER